jgi:GNAT superfamily N-acetyltransferase
LVRIDVRPATEDDLPAVLALYAQLAIGDEDSLPLNEARHVFARFSSYPDYTLYVATLESRVVGTFALLIMDNLAHMGAPSGLVEDVAVEPSLQGQGIGKQMMRFAMARCRERGCYKLALSANHKRLAAHRFYESLGFRRHGYSFLIELPADEAPPQ